jgi:N-acyl-D-amino-acid deacylase
MTYDLIIKGGTIYEGDGGSPFVGDVAVSGDEIVKVGKLNGHEAGLLIDAAGMAVAPGFINMLSHSYFSVLQDPRSLGDLKQGVTTQLIGEGWSMGPLNEAMKNELLKFKGRLQIEVTWTRLSEYLAHIDKLGVSQNFASLVGATTIRINVLGHENRSATVAELDRMRGLVEEEMADGAFGIGSALIYAPGTYATTEELIALCKAAAPYGGKYFSHLRSEGTRFLEGVDELLTISREAQVPAEIWHLKAAGRENFSKMDEAIEKVETVRSSGEPITADLYPYTAGATWLAAAIPPWLHEGGFPKLLERLADPAVRTEVREVLEAGPSGDWENLYSSGPESILIMSVVKDEMKIYQGKTLAQIATELGKDPIDCLIGLVLEAEARIGAAYFMIDEENIRKEIALPWVSFGSDAASMAPEGVFLESSTHPRAYGTFARVLGKYVREEKALSLHEAIRRLTSFPAETLGLDRRGRLKEGYFADLVIFDPKSIADHATYKEPHQFAVGVRDVVVNGNLALRDGEFAGNFGGRALHGPGRKA